MFTKSTFAILSGIASLALGGILVHPDDPYASLAATASSYEEWVNRIINVAAKADGDSPQPSPSPVVSVDQQEALEASVNATLPTRGNTLAARQASVNCNINTPAFAPDAARCVSHLASLGAQECRIDVSATLLCQDHAARVLGVSRSGQRANSCNNVARAGGRILDVCTQSNNQVTGQSVLDSDTSFNVIIAG